MTDLAKQIFEQANTLAKAHGYDIVSAECGRLRKQANYLFEAVQILLTELQAYEDAQHHEPTAKALAKALNLVKEAGNVK